MVNYTLYSDYELEEPTKEQLYDFWEEMLHIPAKALQKLYENTCDRLAYVQKNKISASVTTFALPMIINHVYTKSVGIHCILPNSEYCEKDMVKHLIHNLLENINGKYENIFVFTEHPDLYTSFDFQVIPQQVMSMSYKKENIVESPLKQLNCTEEEDLQLIQEILEEGQSLSREFSSLNHQVSSYLNMKSDKWNDKLYYSNNLDAIVIYEVVDQVLKLYGVYAPIIPILDEVCAEIKEAFSEINFYFCPDQLGVENTKVKTYTSTKSLMVKGKYVKELTGYKYPILSEF